MIDIEKDIIPGNKIKIFYNEGNINNKIMHILAIIEDRVVFKVWSKKRQDWIYDIQSLYFFEFANRDTECNMSIV